ncbi:MAG TPA: condensation domain-containing protein, partial [Candidatus Deferrimicrobium sp.]|nr:condensation domain-containing protein [Candidatus Deferrimicrobium sp.]
IDHHFLQMEKLLPGRFEKAGKAGSPAGAASPGSETAAEKNMPDIYSPRPGLSAEYVAPRDLLEQGLAEMWQRNFGLEKIGIHDNFFELGGDSLKGIMLINKYQKILDAKIEVTTIFNCPTIAQLADYFTEHYPQSASRIRQGKKAHENTHVSIRPAEKENYYTLSSPQRRIYILQQMDPKSTAYNITLVVELVGQLQEEKLEETFKKLIARHESFRTSFFTLNDEVVQKVHTEVDFNVDIRSEVAKGNITNDFIRPFDLSCAPLLRVGLLKKSGEQYILMADMHHIISDGTSISILAGEFMDLYAGKAMNPLKIQYKDYVIWQSSDNEKERIKKQETWWLQEFSGEIPVLNLPLDYPRAALQSFAGSRKIFTAEAGELEVLKRIAREQGGTLYMLMLGIYSIFLYKLSGQQEVVIGSPVANRRHSDLDTVIGMFVNTLAIRTYLAGSMPFKGFLTGIIEKTLAAFENQEYPFEDLVEKVAINRDLSRNPLFDVSFLLQNIELPEIEIPGLKLKPYAYENNTAKFDLILQAFEIKAPGNGEILKFDLEYSTQLFNSETIERFTAYYKKILTAVTRDPGQKIAGIEIISEEEMRQILEDFNAAAVEYPRDKTIRQLFAEQVEKSSDSIALVGADLRVCPNLSTLPIQPVSLSYHCLSRQSDCLAGLLIQKSVVTGDIVAIMMERSIDLIIGILGILKAGGAYLPIDPDYPQERIDYMLKDSGVRILINKSEIRN